MYERTMDTLIKIFQICLFLLESYDIALSITVYGTCLIDVPRVVRGVI